MQILRILLCPVPLPNLLSVVKEFREDILFNCEQRYNENRNNLQLKLNNLQFANLYHRTSGEFELVIRTFVG